MQRELTKGDNKMRVFETGLGWTCVITKSDKIKKSKFSKMINLKNT